VIDRIVFHPELADAEHPRQAVGSDERGETGVETDLGLALDRQQLAIAPEVARSRLDGIARHLAGDPLVIVDDLQGAEAGLANVDGHRGVVGAAFPAFQTDHCAHAISFDEGPS
jgi:hypothetical protein